MSDVGQMVLVSREHLLHFKQMRGICFITLSLFAIKLYAAQLYSRKNVAIFWRLRSD